MKALLTATMVAGVLSLAAFVLERLALTDIFHGEADTRLEWTIVNAAFLPVVLFHVLGLVSAGIGLSRLGGGAGRRPRGGDEAPGSGGE